MALGIYKQGQGYWTRMMTFMGGMVMFAWGGSWLYNEIRATDNLAAAVTFIATLVIGALFMYWIAYSKPRSSEFFIATEGEMRKVNWSSRREVMGSTWVVIGLAVFLALVLGVIDLLFSIFFRFIGVLQSGS